MKKSIFTLLLLAFALIIQAQEAQEVQENIYSKDSESPQALMHAVIDVISGPKGEARDWNRFRYLFLNSASLGVVATDKAGNKVHRIFPLEDFIKNNGPNYAKDGFYEVELGNTVEEWNGIASGMQSYEWTIPNTDLSQRGINNYQFLFSGNRWFIVNLIFASENEANPIPEEYITSEKQESNMGKGKVTGLGGIFFKCDDIEKQRAWYNQHLGIEMESWGGSVFRWHTLEDKETVATTTWGPFKADTEYFNPSQKNYMFNYRVDDLEAILAKLKEAGVEIVGEVEEYEYGKFGWIMDPEGNKIELWEPIDGVFE